MEQVLYSQVVEISRKDLKFIAENKNKNEAKFKFQGQFGNNMEHLFGDGMGDSIGYYCLCFLY